MARNKITIEEIVTEYMIGLTPDDYTYGISRTKVRNIALHGARRLGFMLNGKVKSLRMPINKDLMCVELPDDFVDWIKIGQIGSDGLVYVFGQNNNISSAMRYSLDSSGNPIDTDGDGVFDRVQDKTVPPTGADVQTAGTFLFRNYILRDQIGSLYGIGGGQYSGEFRFNSELNRFEISTSMNIDEVIIEYVCDEALDANPSVHPYAENTMYAYIYYKLIEKKAGVPNVEKARARAEYYNEQRLANAMFNPFTKEEALKTIRKNFKQSPKY